MAENARIDRGNRGEDAADDRRREDESDRPDRRDEDADVKGRDIPPPKAERDPKGPWLGGG